MGAALDRLSIAMLRGDVEREAQGKPSLWGLEGMATALTQFAHALTAQELARVLRMSPRTILRQAKAGRIPHFRIGNCIRFDPKLIADWLKGKT